VRLQGEGDGDAACEEGQAEGPSCGWGWGWGGHSPCGVILLLWFLGEVFVGGDVAWAKVGGWLCR
jgi:hypothetical protein